MRHRRAGLVSPAVVACLLVSSMASVRAADTVTPPPILYAVPDLHLRDTDGGSSFGGGFHAALAVPLSWRTSVTAGHYFNFSGADTSTALLNFDRLLGPHTLIRGSAGLFDDDFGYGITAHRRMEAYGLGAFVHRVDGEWVGGISLTRAIDWGVKLSRSGNMQSVGGVGQHGATMALTYSDFEGRGYSFSTTPAYFPSYARDAGPPPRPTDETAQQPSMPPPITRQEPAQTIDATMPPTDTGTIARLPAPRADREPRAPAVTGVPEGLAFGPIAHLAWRYDDAGPVRSETPVVDGVAFVGGIDGMLRAIEARSGKELWSYPLDSSISAGVAVRDGRLYVGTQDGRMVCLPVSASGRAAPRSPTWSFTTGAAVIGTLLLTDKGLLFFGTDDSTVRALDAVTGELMWSHQLSSATVARGAWAPYSTAKAAGKGESGSMPGAIIAGATNGRVYAFDEQTGAPAWTLYTGAPIAGAAAVIGATAYICNYEGRLFALAVADGRVEWERQVGAQVVADTVATDRMVLVASMDAQVQAYAPDDGRRFWRRAMSGPVSVTPTIVDDTVAYVASDDGAVRALALDSGRELWGHDTGQPFASRPVIGDGAMLVGGREIGLYGYRSGPGEGIRVASLPQAAPTAIPSQPTQPAQRPPVVDEGDTTTQPQPTPRQPIVIGPTQAPTWKNWGKPRESQPTDVEPAQDVAHDFPAPTGPLTPAPTVAQAPAVRVEGSASTGIQSPAGPTPSQAAEPRTTQAERDLPTISTPQPDPVPDKPSNGGFQREDTPTPGSRPAQVPDSTDPAPPADPTPGVIQPPAVAMPEPDDDPLHMTVLTDAVAGDSPLLVTNRNYAHVGGKIGDPSMVARIEVNGAPAAMDGATFLHKEVFDGPGLYTMRVVAISPHGVTSERTRRVRVIAPSDPQVRESFVIQGTPVKGSRYVSFTVGMGGKIHGEMLVMEVQTSDGTAVARWTHAGPGPTVVNWDGHNMSGEAVLPGEYMGVFALMLGDQLLARIRQPLKIDY